MERPKIEINEKKAAELSPSTDRGLENRAFRRFDSYEDCLRLEKEDLIGKEILDIGSGHKARFAQEAEKLPNTKVVSFDFTFDRPKQNDPEKLEEERGASSQVRGLFTALPFRDESFDLVVSNAAMPLYLNTPQQIESAFKEVARVLRKGGKAYIGPVTYTDIVDTDSTKPVSETFKRHSYEESEKLFTEILEKLEDTISFEFLPEEFRYKIDNITDEQYKHVFATAVLIITKK